MAERGGGQLVADALAVDSRGDFRVVRGWIHQRQRAQHHRVDPALGIRGHAQASRARDIQLQVAEELPADRRDRANFRSGQERGGVVTGDGHAIVRELSRGELESFPVGRTGSKKHFGCAVDSLDDGAGVRGNIPKRPAPRLGARLDGTAEGGMHGRVKAVAIIHHQHGAGLGGGTHGHAHQDALGLLVDAHPHAGSRRPVDGVPCRLNFRR